MNKLIGQLQSINSVKPLVGQLQITTSMKPLVGTLTWVKNKVLVGNIKIPPEVPIPNYQEEYTIVSKPFNDEVLSTRGLKMIDDITVSKIPYYQTSNDTGYTIYIGGE